MPHDDQVNQDQSRDHRRNRRREASHDREDHHDDREPPGPAAQVEESDADPDPDEAEYEHDRADDARGQAEGERQSDPDEDQRGDDEQEPEADDQDTKEDCEDSEESYADRPGRRRVGAGWVVTGRRGGHGSFSGRSEQPIPPAPGVCAAYNHNTPARKRRILGKTGPPPRRIKSCPGGPPKPRNEPMANRIPITPTAPSRMKIPPIRDNTNAAVGFSAIA